jgi:hypothetical protein
MMREAWSRLRMFPLWNWSANRPSDSRGVQAAGQDDAGSPTSAGAFRVVPPKNATPYGIGRPIDPAIHGGSRRRAG